MSESLAVLLAAVISASVAVISLVISKENKISEFRQEWIDGLRADVAALIGSIAANSVGQHNAESARDMLTTIHEYECRISLRFKKGDERASKLLNSVLLLGRAAANFDVMPYRHAEDVRLATQEILKEEWERVKMGEPRYQVTLRISKVAIVAATCLFAIYAAMFSAVHIIFPSIMWFASRFKA